MASNQFYIVNQPTPSLVKSGSYECKEGAVRLTCTGMGATGNAVQVWVGPPVTGVWQNLVRYGVPVIMSNNMTQYVEVLAGRYRIDPAGLLGSAIVYVQEDDETDHDDKIVVTYSQQNNNQNGITGESTTTNAVVGNGTNANPLGYNVIVSPDANNGLSVHPNGLFATEGISTVQDTATVDLGGLGTVASPLTANAIVSPDAGNTLAAHANGLFAAPIISPDAGNIIVAHPNGLYASLTALTNLSQIDGLALLLNYISSLSYTSGTFVNVTSARVITTPFTVVGYITIAIKPTATFLNFTGGLTRPAQGSIGPTNVASVNITANNTVTSLNLPVRATNSATNWELHTTGNVVGNLTNVQFQVVFTLQ